jgi:hypothetical protein
MSDVINICACGVQDGYPHKEDCPYPYFGNHPDELKKWLAAQKSKKKMDKLLSKK